MTASSSLVKSHRYHAVSTTQALVAGLISVWALNIPIAWGVTSSSLVVVAAAPMWVTAVRSFRWGTILTTVSVLAIVNGLVLSIALSTSRPFSTQFAMAQAWHLVAGLGGIGLLLWARAYLRLSTIAVLLGGSLLLSSLSSIPTSDNAWKYLISAPITVLVLGLLDRKTPLVQMLALSILAAIGFSQDSRSYTGLCALTLAFMLLQRRPGSSGRVESRNYLAALGLGAVIIFSLYSLTTAAILDGYLGESTQARTQEQIDRGGNLLSGGRPEWNATGALIREQPIGFGFGAAPTYSDIWIAREGLARVGVGPENGYVDAYMFNDTFNLHSVLADMWVQCGVFGVILGLLLYVVFIQGLAGGIASQRLPTVVIFLASKALWDLSFSPIYSSLPWIAMAAGLLLKPREPRRQADYRGNNQQRSWHPEAAPVPTLSASE